MKWKKQLLLLLNGYRKMKKLINLLWIIPLVVVDQVTKYLAVLFLKDGPVAVIPKVFVFHYLENKGAAFGILQNKRGLFLLTTILVLAAVIWFYSKIPDDKKYKALKVIMVFISAGAIGNGIDRLINNYVIDFLYLKIIRFPIFNIADMYVSISAVILLFLFIFYYKESDFNFLNSSK